jgi:hypothetical protein
VNSQFDMLQPVLRSLNKIIQEPIPHILNETLETEILLLINHLYKKTSLEAPVNKLDYCIESKLVQIPTIT